MRIARFFSGLARPLIIYSGFGALGYFGTAALGWPPVLQLLMGGGLPFIAAAFHRDHLDKERPIFDRGYGTKEKGIVAGRILSIGAGAIMLKHFVQNNPEFIANIPI